MNTTELYDHVLAVATNAFGDSGRDQVLLWSQYNRDYFAGELPPVPLGYFRRTIRTLARLEQVPVRSLRTIHLHCADPQIG